MKYVKASTHVKNKCIHVDTINFQTYRLPKKQFFRLNSNIYHVLLVDRDVLYVNQYQKINNNVTRFNAV